MLSVGSYILERQNKMFMFFGLLAVVAFETRRMPLVHCKIAIILNRTMRTLHKAYIHELYVRK